jgi:nitric oxide reductase subunit B
MRGLTDVSRWNYKLLKVFFWLLNIGLAIMTFLSLPPQGIWQTYASMKYSYGYVRSAEFLHSSIMKNLVWMRVPSDVVFGVGGGAFTLFYVSSGCRTEKE